MFAQFLRPLTAFLRDLLEVPGPGEAQWLSGTTHKAQISGNLNATDFRGHHKTSLLWSLGIDKEDEVEEAQAWS